MTKDDYLKFEVTWSTGFKHTVYCRGYNYKSTLADLESIKNITKIVLQESDQKEHQKKYFSA